jgi:transposase
MKQIYGIDLSKEKFDVSFIDSQGIEQWKVIKNTYSGICRFLESIPEDAILVAEYTGVYGDLLVFLAQQSNIFISLATGYNIKHSLGLQKGKNDKIDAARIREYGKRFIDKLQLTKFESESLTELSELSTLRNQLVKERKMLLTLDEKKKQCPYSSIKARNFTTNMLHSFDMQITNIEKEMIEIISQNKDIKENYDLITSIKGFGPVTTTELIIKTRNFKKIKTAKQAASFAGVCPFSNKSGKMVGKAKVSHMSDKRLKTLLYMCAKTVVKHNKEYRLYYQKKSMEGKQHFLIMNNISNKLLRTVYSVVNSKMTWDPNYICLDPRENIKKVA